MKMWKVVASACESYVLLMLVCLALIAGIAPILVDVLRWLLESINAIGR